MSCKGFARVALAALALSSSAVAAAGDLGISGSVAVEARSFPSVPAFADQLDGIQGSLLLEPEFSWESEGGRHQIRFEPFFRLDGEDEERTHFDLRELYWRYVGEGWDVLVGFNKVFWGVTESRHLVDVINQADQVEDIDEEDKLGQPMIAFTSVRSWGTLSLFALPGFRERTFPGLDGRLRAPRVVEPGATVFESRVGDDRLDWALRYSYFFGDWDLGLHYFDGTSREPVLVPLGEDRLRPRYDVIRQVGVDLQRTHNAWLFKLEGTVREAPDRTYGALVGGLEYTLFQVGGSAADVGLLAEVLYDDRDPLTAPPTAFEEDLFVGSRLARNDIQDTQALLGAIIDRDDGSLALFVEFERRLGSRFTLEIESRLFTDVDPENFLAAVARDDFITLRLARHF